MKLFEMHNRFKGRFTDHNGHIKEYCAADPAHLSWVLMTLVERSILSYETFVTKLSDAEKENFFQESCALATLMGIPPSDYPTSLDEMIKIFHATVSNELIPSAEVNSLAQDVLKGPFYSWRKLNRFLCTGFLPQILRRRFDMEWSNEDQTRFEKRINRIHKFYTFFPGWARYAPHYRIVMLRSRWKRLGLYLHGRKVERE